MNIPPGSVSDSAQLSGSSSSVERQTPSPPHQCPKKEDAIEGNNSVCLSLLPATHHPQVKMASSSPSPVEEVTASKRKTEINRERNVPPQIGEEQKTEGRHDENTNTGRQIQPPPMEEEENEDRNDEKTNIGRHRPMPTSVQEKLEEISKSENVQLADRHSVMLGVTMEEERQQMMETFQIGSNSDETERITEREQTVHKFQTVFSTDETETETTDIKGSGCEPDASSQGKMPSLQSVHLHERENKDDEEDCGTGYSLEEAETGNVTVGISNVFDRINYDTSFQGSKPQTDNDDTHNKKAKNRADDFVMEVTASLTSSEDVTETDDKAADIRDDHVMIHSNTSSSPSPSASSLPHDHRSADDTRSQSDTSDPLWLPDIISSHGTCDPNGPVKLNNFYCASAESRNYIQRCGSSDNDHCQKRSALIFPDLMADVGGCLCSRCDLRDRLPAGWPDVFDDVLPDLIVTHGFLDSENCSDIKMTLGKTILVTGGAGYIGSHTVIELVEAGYDIIVVDNLVNASMESVRRVEKIVGKTITSYSVDLLNKPGLEEIFKKHTVFAVIHFAGLKAVGESCELPLLYYKTNVGGTTNLLEVMEANKVYNMVFSSSATVYGTPQFLPLTEGHPVGGCTNPYGKTKFMIEQILSDLSASNKNWNIVILRYFNPVGAHKSGTIGEDPSGVPNNLMPFIGQVAVGRRAALKVYGSDYDTHDGTGVRDYIHVVDLAQGHVAALRKLNEECGLKVYNLGTGHGCSVMDMIKAFEKASGKKIPYELAPRRAGDVPAMYSDPSLASKELGWSAKKDLDEMCTDLWRWQSQNPQGYNVDIKG